MREFDKPEQFPMDEILNEDDRLYRGWGTVEVKDVDGEILPISEFKKIMPHIIKRGGLIMDSHSNRPVGKIINYEFKEHPIAKTEGLLLTVENFKGYQSDDEHWEAIKRGDYTGFSFGGRNRDSTIKFEKGNPVKILEQIEGFEFSDVHSPANKSSNYTEINYLAKSDKSKEEIQKPFAGYENFKACVLANKDKKDPEAYCATIMNAVEKADKEYSNEKIEEGCSKPEEKNKDGEIKETDKLINNKELEKSMVEETQKAFPPQAPAPAQAPQAPMANPLEARVTKLEQDVAQILQLVQSSAASNATMKEDAKDVTLPKTVDEKIQSKDPATGAKDDKVSFVEKADYDKLAKSVDEIKKSLESGKATTPRPGVGENLIKKEDSTIPAPKNFKEAHALARQIKRR
jgi:hypothetical protein